MCHFSLFGLMRKGSGSEQHWYGVDRIGDGLSEEREDLLVMVKGKDICGRGEEAFVHDSTKFIRASILSPIPDSVEFIKDVLMRESFMIA